jgi:glycosyltransferase involved in cell wall biosynthesis
VKPDDHEALRRALSGLIARPTERARLAEAARSRALHFTHERMADAYLAAYASLHPGFAPAETREVLCVS